MVKTLLSIFFLEPLVVYPPYPGTSSKRPPRMSKRLEQAMPALEEMQLISLARARQTGLQEGYVGAGQYRGSLTLRILLSIFMQICVLTLGFVSKHRELFTVIIFFL
jgi:hypothetical protein